MKTWITKTLARLARKILSEELRREREALLFLEKQATKRIDLLKLHVSGLESQLVEKDKELAATNRLVDLLQADLKSHKQELRVLHAAADAATPETKDVAAVSPEIEAEISYLWGRDPEAAQMTRTYARAQLARGVPPERVAYDMRNHGIVIE